MDDFLNDLERLNAEQELINHIITELPDCVPAALTVIAMVIDKYAATHRLSSSSVWKVLIDVSSEVHKELGDFKFEGGEKT